MDRQYKPGAGTLLTRAPADGIAGTPGKRTLVEAEVTRGFGAGSPVHATPAAPRVAERARAPLNAVLKVVAYDAHGNVLRAWGAKAMWDGKLPQHFHGDHGDGGWRWDDATSARTVRVHTRADGSGGESVEAWAGTLHAARVEIFAEPIDAVTERAQARPDNVRDPNAPGHADDARNPGDGSAERAHHGGHRPGVVTHQTSGPHGIEDHAPNNGAPRATPAAPVERGSGAASAASGDVAGPDERLADAIAFEHELGIDLTQDDAHDGEASAEPQGKNATRGPGYEGGNPAGRTGNDAATTGQGPGGAAAKAGGDDAGSTSTRDNHGTRTGDRDGEHNGSPNGRYAGEGRDGDNGVRGAGAILGGVVAVPAALQGAVELALLMDAGRSAPSRGGYGRGHRQGRAGRRSAAAKPCLRGPRISALAVAAAVPKTGSAVQRHRPSGLEPYAKVLPNGQKKVRITYTGSRSADFAAANKAAKLEKTPRGYSWHHDESDMGMMYLVPDDLHHAIRHSGGVAEHRHRHGIAEYD